MLDFPNSAVPANALIDNIVVHLRWERTQYNPAKVDVAVTTASGEDWTNTNQLTTDLNTYSNSSLTLDKNPRTGARWTSGDIDALRVGLKRSSEGGHPRVTQLWIDVQYQNYPTNVDRVVHTFIVTSPNGVDATIGHESGATSYGADGSIWSKTSYTWTAATIFECDIIPGYPGYGTRPCVTFAQLDNKKIYPSKDDSNTFIETDYEYDTNYGVVTKVTELGLGSADAGQQKTTETAYQLPSATDPYVVVPKWQKVYPPDNPDGLLSQTLYYYDGARDIDMKPTEGNLTAVSKLEAGGDNPTYATAYTTYDTYGNVTEVTQPAAGLPSDGGTLTDLATTVTTYDSTYHAYPVTVSKQSAASFDIPERIATATPPPTATRTPTLGPTATRTRTPTRGPTATRTRTPTATLMPCTVGANVGSGNVLPGGQVTVRLEADGVCPPGLGQYSVSVTSFLGVVQPVSCVADPQGVMDSSNCHITYNSNQYVSYYTVSVTASRISAGATGDVPLADITYEAVGSTGSSTYLYVGTNSMTSSSGGAFTVSNGTGTIGIVSALTPTPTNTPTPTETSTPRSTNTPRPTSTPAATPQPPANDTPLTQTTTLDYDYVLGVVTSQTGPNGDTVHIEYDGFGRPTKVWDDFDSEEYPTKAFEYHWNGEEGFNWTTTWQRTTSGESTALGQTVCYDGFGRTVQTRILSSPDTDTVQATQYDLYGRVAWAASYSEARPESGSCTQNDPSKPKTSATYDPLGRVLTVTNPDDTSRSEDHSTLTSAVIDENGHKKASTVNGFGEVVQVQEFTGSGSYSLYATTSYAYDRLGNLTTVTDAEGNQTTMSYDMLGRKVAMDDMDMGAWSYQYDVSGNLTQQTDALERDTDLVYDLLGRLVWKTGDGINVAYYYDVYDDTEFCSEPAETAIGQATKMEDTSGTTRWCYDSRGRVVKERKTIDGVDYDVSGTFDSANRPTGLTYPDGEVVDTSYWDDGTYTTGQLAAVESETYGSEYFSAGAYTLDKLQLQSLQLGTSPETTISYSYDVMGRLTGIEGGPAQDLSYTYDNVGNIASITDASGGPAEITSFTYDSLDRLTGASGGYSASYSYSANGRILTKSEDQSLTLSYDDASHVHAATSATSEASSFQMRYDANGNMVTENDDTFGYNGDNQLVSRTEGDTTITYVYDGQGNLVKKSSSDGTPVVYIGGIYEVHQDGSYVTYYGTFGRRIAMRLHEGGGDSGSLHFLLADQVGSTSSIIDEGGSVEESAKYYPFGSLRSGGLELSDRAFTGQQDEGGGFGLYDYGARFYSSIIGRFVSADPIGGQGDPQTIDRYSYVRNNPLRNIDPTGLVCSPTGGLGDCSQEELDWWTAEHQKQDPGCCETGSLKWLADWINNLMTGPLELSRDQALTRIQLTAYWADYYRNAVAAYHENSKVDPGNETTWLIALSMQCPGCFSDIHWIPEFNPNNEIPRSGGVVGMAEPWMCNNQPGCWTTPDPEVTSTNNPDWVNWANLTLMTYVWLRDDVLLSPEEIAIMPWSGPQRHQISFTFPMPGTRNFFDSTIDTIWESLPDIIWNFY